MVPVVRLGVYRMLDDRMPDCLNPAVVELLRHSQRRDALVDVLEGNQVRVLDWGDARDDQPHEFVELVIEGGVAALQYAIVPGLLWLGERLAEKAVDEGTSSLAKWLTAKIRPKQNQNKVLDIKITLPDGTRIEVDPPDRNGTIAIVWKDGQVQQVDYRSTNK